METAGGLKGAKVELGDNATCMGPIVGGTVRIGSGSRVQDVYCSDLEVGRRTSLGNVYAESVRLDDDCFVGKLVYTRELREGDRVRHGAPPAKAETLPQFPL